MTVTWQTAILFIVVFLAMDVIRDLVRKSGGWRRLRDATPGFCPSTLTGLFNTRHFCRLRAGHHGQHVDDMGTSWSTLISDQALELERAFEPTKTQSPDRCQSRLILQTGRVYACRHPQGHSILHESVDGVVWNDDAAALTADRKPIQDASTNP